MIVVVGAGAAGLAAAVFACGSRQPVTLIESTADGGRKILISGGGRCNVLPEALEPKRFVTDSPAPLVQRFLRSWPLRAQREFFERDVGVPLKLEADSRKWFPVSDRARDVRDGLIALARRKGVSFRFNTELVDLQASRAGWSAMTTQGDLQAAAVVLATGGLSVPATGSTGIGLKLARALGHVAHETYPALTPLVAAPARHAHLSGVSLNVRLRAGSDHAETEAHGGFLFTHRGYSGPSVLDVSHVAVRSAGAADVRATIRVRWSELEAPEWHRELTAANGPIVHVVGRRLPKRLAEQLVLECGLPIDRRAAELRREERTTLVDRLVHYELPWTGDEGYRKAEVTGGGVALDEVDPRTLESRRHRGLFLCGELLDAFGPIGGHNFAWAWATGRLAGLGAAAAS
ncbi:MAG TPA: aminoacetone oxidase family FAD-binding enzyme [Vicinamibacterales bacterium]|nr:aminoacetone oxidase family FAD-binding enzyme [Vicinamibacterales bacterium]